MALSKIDLSKMITGTLATGNGGTGATSYSPGKIGQVVSASSTSITTTSSTSFVTTGLTVTIPSLATTSSKVLIQVDSPTCYEDNSPNSYVFCTLYANIGSAGDTDLGASSSKGFSGWYESGIAYGDLGWNASFNFLHSPSSTADVVYTVYFRTNTSSASYVWGLEGKGTITAMEVLA
jgi:hypothetical protein